MATPPGSSQRPGTRNSTQGNANPTAGKTREELLKATISTVHNEKTAKEYLERKCLVITGECYSLTSLSMALLHLSQTTALSKVVVDGLRTTALIMENMEAQVTVSKVAEALTTLLHPTTERLETTLTDLQSTTDNLRSAAVSITNTADEFTENTTSTLQHLADAASSMVNVTEDMEVVAKAQKQNPIPTLTTTMPASSLSYAAAVATGVQLTPEQITTIARGDARSCQVLVDKAPNADHNGLKELTEKELVEKARIALEQLEQTDQLPDIVVQFVGAKKLRNGGVIYEMNTAEAAHWLKSEDNITNFLQVFSAISIIKQQVHSIIAEYVLVSFSPDDRMQLASIETVNRLEPGGILNAQWIKPIYCRKQGQRTAHAILGYVQPEEANSAIRNGVIIAGKRVWAWKLLQEPRRCLKCQQIGVCEGFRFSM